MTSPGCLGPWTGPPPMVWQFWLTRSMIGSVDLISPQMDEEGRKSEPLDYPVNVFCIQRFSVDG